MYTFSISVGHWLVLPYTTVWSSTGSQKLLLAEVPQRDCKLRLIVNYKFSGVNKAMVKLVLPGSMQFGNACDQII
jgi:hypothetical protein